MLTGSRTVVFSLLLFQFVAGGCDRRAGGSFLGERNVVDDLGRNVRIEGIPTRIISLAPSLTETLFALGADSLVLGVTSYCNYPPAAALRTQVGDLLTPDIESIVGLEPDLVLISVEGNSQQTFRRLEQLGIRIFVSNPRDLEGVLKSIKDIASITGRDSAGLALVKKMRAMLDSVRSHPPTRAIPVLTLLSVQPLIAAGGGTFIDELIVTAGGRNVAADAMGSYPVFSREEILLRDPEMLLFPDDLGIERQDLLRQFPEWRTLRAAQNNRIHALPADVLMRPGPRIFEALCEVHRLLTEAVD